MLTDSVKHIVVLLSLICSLSFLIFDASAAVVGKLELRSVPLGAKVFLDGKLKGKGDITVENVSAGQHKIVFQNGGQKLSGTFTVTADKTLKLKGHFKENRIIDVSELEAEEARRYLPFVDNGNGTISDVKDNRMWADEPRQADIMCSGSYECGYQVYEVCEKLDFAGYRDWRVPTFDEVQYGLGDASKLEIFRSLKGYKDWYIWAALTQDSRRDKTGRPFVVKTGFGGNGGYREENGGTVVFCVRNR